MLSCNPFIVLQQCILWFCNINDSYLSTVFFFIYNPDQNLWTRLLNLQADIKNVIPVTYFERYEMDGLNTQNLATWMKLKTENDKIMIKLLDNWYIGIKTFIKMFKVRDRSKCPYIKKLFPSLFYYENLMWWRFYGEMPMYHVYRRYSKTWVRIPMHVRCIVFERGRLIQKILTKRIIHTWNYENPNIWLGGGG